MADRRREFRAGCYIFSLDRSPRQVEERAAEEWAFDQQNRIAISRGFAQRVDAWGIPFPTIIPNPYKPTLRPASEPSQYKFTRATIAVNAGAPFYMWPMRTLHRHLQGLPLRTECTQTLRPHPHLPPFQLPPTILPPLHASIHGQAPSLISQFRPVPHNIDTQDIDTTAPPANTASTSTSTSARPQHPTIFSEFYRQDGAGWARAGSQAGAPPHPVTDLMHFLTYMMDWVPPVVHATLHKMYGLGLWISVQFRYIHPAREVKDMKAPYLHT